MSGADEVARAAGIRRAEAIARLIEAEARAEYPAFTVMRDGATVTISGRGVGAMRLDDPLLANPAELAR